MRDIKFVDLEKQYEGMDFTDLLDIFKTGYFVGGPNLQEFQAKATKYLGAPCCGVGSGTDALILALRALEIGPGDEVIVPTNTFIATAIAVEHVGAKVIFADVETDTYNISVNEIIRVISVRTRAIIPVHLYGRPCDMDPIIEVSKKYNLFVIEDCAQAFGAEYKGRKVGTIGHAGCYSFYPAKNLGASGQGGLVVSKDPEVIKFVDRCSNLGRTDEDRYTHDMLGYNSRLDTVSAAFLTKCLTKIDEWNMLRFVKATIYNELLEDSWVSLPASVDKPEDHTYHLYEIDCIDPVRRNKLKEFLHMNGVMCGLHYPINCHKQPHYKEYNNITLPVSERLAQCLLSLPMHPFLTRNEIVRVCDLIKEFGNG